MNYKSTRTKYRSIFHKCDTKEKRETVKFKTSVIKNTIYKAIRGYHNK